MIMKSLFEIGNNSFEFLLKFDKQRRKEGRSDKPDYTRFCRAGTGRMITGTSAR